MSSQVSHPLSRCFSRHSHLTSHHVLSRHSTVAYVVAVAVRQDRICSTPCGGSDPQSIRCYRRRRPLRRASPPLLSSLSSFRAGSAQLYIEVQTHPSLSGYIVSVASSIATAVARRRSLPPPFVGRARLAFLRLPLACHHRCARYSHRHSFCRHRHRRRWRRHRRAVSPPRRRCAS